MVEMVVHKGIWVQTVSPTQEKVQNEQALNTLLNSKTQGYEIPKKNHQL